ncbi:MAG: FapA family protein [Oscillospiraceae bacterium]|jgi:uncharacterized protein (DUF342 family)|nr:FapA family protein [Oscillospiraceae bacterium]
METDILPIVPDPSPQDIPPLPVPEPEPEPPPPPVDATVTVSVNADKRGASVFLTPPENGGNALGQPDISDALERAGVIFGVRGDLVARLALEPIYSSPIPIADAKPPVDGKDGFIEYHFSTDRTRKPQLRADGTVDYKELGDLPNVRKGEQLATLYAADPGIPGINVLGGEIPAKPGKTPRLAQGKNTVLDSEGKRLVSTMDGQVSTDSSNRITVQNTYTVEGDVDVATGNITFVGNVTVLGSIQNGYTVRAEGSVNVRGYVDGGSIYAGGSVTIGDGYLGNSGSEIVCSGNLACKHIHHGRVSVDGNLETGRLYHSEIRCGGTVKMQGTRSTIIGGKLFVRYEVECHTVGSRMSGAETRIEVGSDPVVSVRAGAIPIEEKQIDKQIAGIERLLDVLQQLKDRGRLDQDRIGEYNKIRFTLQTLQNRRLDLFAEKEIVEEKMRTIGYGTITIRGTAYPGVVIVIGPEYKKLAADIFGIRFFRTQEGLETAPIR